MSKIKKIFFICCCLFPLHVIAHSQVLQSNTAIIGVRNLEIAWIDNVPFQTSQLHIQWSSEIYPGPPLLLCSSEKPQQLFSNGYDVFLTTEYLDGHYLTRLTPLLLNTGVLLTDFGVIWKNCSYVDSNNSNSFWKIDLEFKNDQIPFWLSGKLALLQNPQNNSDTQPGSTGSSDSSSGLEAILQSSTSVSLHSSNKCITRDFSCIYSG